MQHHKKLLWQQYITMIYRQVSNIRRTKSLQRANNAKLWCLLWCLSFYISLIVLSSNERYRCVTLSNATRCRHYNVGVLFFYVFVKFPLNMLKNMRIILALAIELWLKHVYFQMFLCYKTVPILWMKYHWADGFILRKRSCISKLLSGKILCPWTIITLIKLVESGVLSHSGYMAICSIALHIKSRDQSMSQSEPISHMLHLPF